jgi:hypothetical protein
MAERRIGVELAKRVQEIKAPLASLTTLNQQYTAALGDRDAIKKQARWRWFKAPLKGSARRQIWGGDAGTAAGAGADCPSGNYRGE